MEEVINQAPEHISKEDIEIIFKKLLSGKKSLSLPRKEKNITLRQTRSYGGSKRKSRKSKIH